MQSTHLPGGPFSGHLPPAYIQATRSGGWSSLASGRVNYNVAKPARFDTGNEHGPQTYLQAVASRAAELEAQPVQLAGRTSRADTIEIAFGMTPAPPRVSYSDPTGFERSYVLAVLQAGDHAADLARLNR